MGTWLLPADLRSKPFPSVLSFVICRGSEHSHKDSEEEQLRLCAQTLHGVCQIGVMCVGVSVVCIE